MDMSLPSVFSRYAEYLNQRIEHGQTLSEDTLRYSFFAAIIKASDVPQHDILLEHPHPALATKRIDTYVQAVGQRLAHYFEFKYHKKTAATANKPQRAGGLFNDFCRLSHLAGESANCFVVYITDRDMAGYFPNNISSYPGFWNGPLGSDFFFNQAFYDGTSESFKSKCTPFVPTYVRFAFLSALHAGHHLRIFQVLGAIRS
jgi:hypothetical protein